MANAKMGHFIIFMWNRKVKRKPQVYELPEHSPKIADGLNFYE